MSLSRLLLDISPLRESRAFRYAYFARAATVLVTGMLMVAASIQLYELTESSVAVAFLTVSMATPMVLALIVGGVLSDRMDRRSLMVWSRSVYIVSVVLFLLNTLLPHPSVWLIYLAAAIGGAAGGISVPAMMAATPALVGRDKLAAAAALSGLAMQLGGIIGPALAGLLISGPGLIFCYVIVLCGVIITPLLLRALPSLPPQNNHRPAQKMLQSLQDGLQFVAGNPLLRALLLIDLAALILATPLALMPEWGDTILGMGAQATGYLYAAPAVGATLAALSSGWCRQLARPGAAIVAAVVVWGLAVAALALHASLIWALACLAIMGAADTISKILRMTLVQKHTPDYLLGRVSSLWMTQYSLGQALGNVQMGYLSRLLHPALAVAVGGLACAAVATGFGILNRGLRSAVSRNETPHA
ncbi:enterobactin transporter EntS [Alcaligenes sp. SDU_A2]|uniref:enterobactin transporter EntS n=1 Tax=Alcaligenes sp. SDU_A2 TaxID=3136634 RepID=UPI00311EBB59